MSRQDLDKWEGIYQRAEDPPAPPESFVLSCVESLEPGSGVDIAGGRGRHALALAARGWNMTLVDISPAGLSWAARTANASGWPLATLAADFDHEDAVQAALPTAAYDLVVNTWFRPTSTMWPRFRTALKPGGHLVYVMPTTLNATRHARPGPRFLLEAGTLPSLLVAAGLTIVSYEESWDDRGHHTARGFATNASIRSEPAD